MFLAKRIDSNNSNIICQIVSMINTSKSGEVKLFKAISELKYLTGNNGWNNDRQQFVLRTGERKRKRKILAKKNKELRWKKKFKKKVTKDELWGRLNKINSNFSIYIYIYIYIYKGRNDNKNKKIKL